MNWQPGIALIIVALAAAWLVRRVFRIVANASGDHPVSCGSCSKNKVPAKTSQLVRLGGRDDAGKPGDRAE